MTEKREKMFRFTEEKISKNLSLIDKRLKYNSPEKFPILSKTCKCSLFLSSDILFL